MSKTTIGPWTNSGYDWQYFHDSDNYPVELCTEAMNEAFDLDHLDTDAEIEITIGTRHLKDAIKFHWGGDDNAKAIWINARGEVCREYILCGTRRFLSEHGLYEPDTNYWLRVKVL